MVKFILLTNTKISEINTPYVVHFYVVEVYVSMSHSTQNIIRRFSLRNCSVRDNLYVK